MWFLDIELDKITKVLSFSEHPCDYFTKYILNFQVFYIKIYKNFITSHCKCVPCYLLIIKKYYFISKFIIWLSHFKVLYLFVTIMLECNTYTLYIIRIKTKTIIKYIFFIKILRFNILIITMLKKQKYYYFRLTIHINHSKIYL